MKRIVLTLVLCCAVAAYSWAADISTIATALKGGNAVALAACMDAEVDVALQGETSQRCNTAGAKTKLDDFFRLNPPSSFEVIHHADKKEKGFFVARLQAGGKTYRVNVSYRTEGDKAIIQSIRIE